MGKRGPKEAYTPDLFELFCTLLEEGKSIRQAAKEIGVDPATAWRWKDQEEGNSQRYARARELRSELFADEIRELSDDSSNDTLSGEKGDYPNSVAVARNKLQIDTRKFLMSKFYPKVYGDRMNIDHSGKVETGPDLSKLPTELLMQIDEALKEQENQSED